MGIIISTLTKYIFHAAADKPKLKLEADIIEHPPEVTHIKSSTIQENLARAMGNIISTLTKYMFHAAADKPKLKLEADIIEDPPEVTYTKASTKQKNQARSKKTEDTSIHVHAAVKELQLEPDSEIIEHPTVTVANIFKETTPKLRFPDDPTVSPPPTKDDNEDDDGSS